MTQDEIIKLANDAELCQTIWIDDSDDEMVRTVIAFAKLVAAKEREACAKVCEAMPTYVGRNNAVTQSSAQDCANAIRARGEA